MKALFWVSLAGIVYAYVGYAVLLAMLARLRRRPLRAAPGSLGNPSVSVLIAARNEEKSLPGKLQNLAALDYPKDRLQIVIASDGSTDSTAEILLANESRLTPVLLPQSGGKAMALNAAVRQATGEILVFLDARQVLDPNAVSELVSCFADPEVGAVSGELHLETANGEPSPDGLGVYWTIEKLVRKLESTTGSVVGVTGAIYAIRRELFQPIPAGTLLDDVFVPMGVARAGKRVLFHSGAIARDRLFADKGKEFGRKVRTLTGNYQLLQLAPWLLTPANPLLFRLISHKLLRLVVPLLLVCLLLSSALASGILYRVALGAQLLLYGLAALGWVQAGLKRYKPVSVAYTFVLLNLAAAVAFYNFVVGRGALGLRP